MYELLIENNGVIYEPIIEGEITWTTERIGSPGKFTFSVVKDSTINFQEGNAVRFRVNGENVFFGYVWDKQRDKEQRIKVTAYDQLRYLKYKDTYTYKNKKASDVLKIIATEQNIKVGDIEDTGHVIAKRRQEDKTFFDIIYDALGLTFDNTKKLYCLYDDYGRLTLKNLESMRLNAVIGENTAEDFDYKTSLDDVYNQIKLVYDNEKTGKKETYVEKDIDNIKSWGKLQYFEKIDEKTNGKLKADTLLAYYNRKNRSLTIKNALGVIGARAGASIVINLPEIGDISIKNYMLIDSATHRFEDNEHFMDLKLKGRM